MHDDDNVAASERASDSITGLREPLTPQSYRSAFDDAEALIDITELESAAARPGGPMFRFYRNTVAPIGRQRSSTSKSG